MVICQKHSAVEFMLVFLARKQMANNIYECIYGGCFLLVRARHTVLHIHMYLYMYLSVCTYIFVDDACQKEGMLTGRDERGRGTQTMISRVEIFYIHISCSSSFSLCEFFYSIICICMYMYIVEDSFVIFSLFKW